MKRYFDLASKVIALFSATLFLPAAGVQAQNAASSFTVAETGRGYDNLQDAVSAISSGSGTILIRPGSYSDCAIQQAGNVSYRAVVPGEVIFDSGICEQKAALVLRGNSASIDGIIFQNMFVPDHNGAGIRLESGDLVVTRSVFRQSQQGIMSGVIKDGHITVDQSTFTGLGECYGGASCAHSIYVGEIASTTITHCRFERGNSGHYLKSRARHIVARDNAFDDSRGQKTNYMIDIPHGASGEISGNVFVQGKNKENWSALITVAPEGKKYDSSNLFIFNNDANIVSDSSYPSAFVADWSGDDVQIGSNRLGRGLTPLIRR